MFLYIFWLKKNQIQALLDEVCHEVVKDGGVKGFCLKRVNNNCMTRIKFKIS